MTCPLFLPAAGLWYGMITTWNGVKAVAAVCTFSNNKKEKEEKVGKRNRSYTADANLHQADQSSQM